jgi:predicted RNase H-like HicB family nuclease
MNHVHYDLAEAEANARRVAEECMAAAREQAEGDVNRRFVEAQAALVEVGIAANVGIARLRNAHCDVEMAGIAFGLALADIAHEIHRNLPPAAFKAFQLTYVNSLIGLLRHGGDAAEIFRSATTLPAKAGRA